MFVAELDHPDRARFDLSSLRTGIMAGSPCPLAADGGGRRRRSGPREITIGYGQTEASPIITMTSVDDPIEVRVGTVGRPIPGLEVRLVDPATRREVPPGEAGRALRPGPLRDGRLLQQPRGDRPRHRRRGLALHRRPGPPPRRRQLPDRRPEQGADHPRRREHLSRPRSRNSSTTTRPSPRSPSSACPTPGTARSSRPGSSPSPARRVTPEDLRDYCRGQIAHYKIPHYIEIVEQLPQHRHGQGAQAPPPRPGDLTLRARSLGQHSHGVNEGGTRTCGSCPRSACALGVGPYQEAAQVGWLASFGAAGFVRGRAGFTAENAENAERRTREGRSGVASSEPEPRRGVDWLRSARLGSFGERSVGFVRRIGLVRRGWVRSARAGFVRGTAQSYHWVRSGTRLGSFGACWVRSGNRPSCQWLRSARLGSFGERRDSPRRTPRTRRDARETEKRRRVFRAEPERGVDWLRSARSGFVRGTARVRSARPGFVRRGWVRSGNGAVGFVRRELASFGAIGIVRRDWLRSAPLGSFGDGLGSFGAIGFVRRGWLRSARLGSFGERRGWVRSARLGSFGELPSITNGFVRRGLGSFGERPRLPMASFGAAGFVRGTARWLRSARLASFGAIGFVRREALFLCLLPTAYCLLPTPDLPTAYRIVKEPGSPPFIIGNGEGRVLAFSRNHSRTRPISASHMTPETGERRINSGGMPTKPWACHPTPLTLFLTHRLTWLCVNSSGMTGNRRGIKGWRVRRRFSERARAPYRARSSARVGSRCLTKMHTE